MLGLKDSLVSASGALPAAASSSTYTSSIDLGLGAHGETAFGLAEFEIDAPALTTTELPNGDVVTYDVVISASSNLSSPVTVSAGVLTQTGAGGAGAAAATQRFRLPLSLNALLASARYLGIRANTGAGTGNCAASSVSVTLVV